jgi:hypothetical protein
MALEEDFTDFLDEDDFAIVATFNGNDVTGILDREYVEIEGIESNRPVFLCSESDVSGYTRGAVIVAGGTTYSLVTKEPDGTGMAMVVMEGP